MDQNKDENDKLMAGNLNPDPMSDASPINSKATEADKARVRVSTVREIITAAANDARAPRRTDTLTTGHFRLDQLTGGFEPGFVWLAGAETNWGKTSWAVSVANENLARGRRVLVVSGEDAESLYGRKFLLLRSRVSADALRHKRLTADEMDRIADVERKAEELPVMLCTNGRPFEKLIPRIEAIVKNEKIDLVIVDYLQALQTERKSKETKDRRHEINYVARLATDCIKNQGVAGLLLSQLTIDKSRKGPPGKYDIRESQDIVNAAEVVVLGFTPSESIYAGENPGRDVSGNQLQRRVQWEEGQRYLLLAKNKAGENGHAVRMDWDTKSACFNRVVDPELARYSNLHDDLGSSDWDR